MVQCVGRHMVDVPKKKFNLTLIVTVNLTPNPTLTLTVKFRTVVLGVDFPQSTL